MVEILRLAFRPAFTWLIGELLDHARNRSGPVHHLVGGAAVQIPCWSTWHNPAHPQSARLSVAPGVALLHVSRSPSGLRAASWHLRLPARRRVPQWSSLFPRRRAPALFRGPPRPACAAG